MWYTSVNCAAKGREGPLEAEKRAYHKTWFFNWCHASCERACRLSLWALRTQGHEEVAASQGSAQSAEEEEEEDVSEGGRKEGSDEEEVVEGAQAIPHPLHLHAQRRS